jgi:hypothetical protein
MIPVYSTPPDPIPITYPQWKRQRIMEVHFAQLSTQQKRQFFKSLSPSLTTDCYFPHIGLTAGEFVVLQQLWGSRAKSS